MNTLEYKTKQALNRDQLQFLRSSLSRTFEIGAISAGNGSIRIEYGERGLQSAIEEATRRLLFIAKSLDTDLVFENSIAPRYTGDPQPHLESVRDVIAIQPGFFTFQGDFLRVFHAINARVREMAREVDAIEQEYPTVWPVRLFKAIDYFHEFPQQVILCAPVKEDYAHREEFARRYAKTSSFTTVAMDDLIADAEYGLEAAVCDCCYYGLEGQSDIPDAFYTCYNKVFRNERSQSGRLDRLTNFSVRDIMFVGTEQHVLESRQRMIEMLSGLIEDLQLCAKIETASDPFFANDAAMKSLFQTTHRLKYELLADIPHLHDQIAVGSVNFHTDFFGNAFRIIAADGDTAHSGCIGIGMERMAYALYCQHGERLGDWPDGVRRYLAL